ncbi:MAG: putative drug exporter of the superfamily [Chloroflexota bacterium]|nr:putative drug exporter of the superfamily [Chloroflexota bacterium]
MSRIFGAIGRLSVRFRYPVVVIWLAVTVLSVHLFPSLSSVSKDTNGGFLPADMASMKAADLARPFLNSNYASAILVASTRSGALSASDQAAILRLEQGIPTLAGDVTVRDLGVSPDGAVRQALIQTRLAPYDGSGEGSRLVDRIRAELSAASGSGDVTYHLTGELPTVVDTQKGASSSRSSTQGVSMLLIVVLLLVAFRALLAPLLTLAPAVMVLLLASPVIAAATRIGVQVSSITQVVLVVLLLGAGTDYGLFLVFRVREELRRGLAPRDAVVRAVTTVGESITFSALTVIAALMSLVVARFGLYQSLGPALAIGIALMLLAGLTLLPAILAIFGRAVFWPSRTRLVENPRTGIYGRIAGVVTRRPLAVAAIGVAGFAALATGSLSAQTAGFADQSTGPAGSDSAAGSAVLAAHLPSPPNPTDVVLRFSQPVWDSLVAVDEAEQQLRASGRVGRVTGPLDLGLTAAQISRIHALTGRDPQQVLATDAPPAGVSAADLNRYRTLGQYIAGGGRTVKLTGATLRGDTSSLRALADVPGLRDTATAIAGRVGAVDSGVFSLPAFAYDVSHLAHDDLATVIPIVAVLIALLLALVMRSLVAPLYLVVSVLLSYLAALGAVAIVFVRIGGSQGINFVLPFLMFVFLMALGSDYNILVMTRIREEAHHLPLAEAVRRAVGATGTTVTTAGVILGGTFAVLAIAAGNAAGADQVRQIGYGIAAGVLMDTFLIRTVLVPAVVTLLGRWNWWPSPLFHRPAGAGAVVTETAAPAGDRPAAA